MPTWAGVAQASRRLDERGHGRVVGHGRIAVTDEVGRGGLEPDRALADDQVTERDVRLEDAARADADEGGLIGDGQDLGHHDLHVVGPDAGRHDGHAAAVETAGDRGELAVLPVELHVLEARGDPLDPLRVTGEEDVLGQLTPTEADVVLPISVRERDAGVRVRQGRPSLVLGPEAGLGEDRAAFARASSERQPCGSAGLPPFRALARPPDGPSGAAGRRASEAVADAPAGATVQSTAGSPHRSRQEQEQGRSGQQGGRRAERDRWAGSTSAGAAAASVAAGTAGAVVAAAGSASGACARVRVARQGKVGHGPQLQVHPAAGRRGDTRDEGHGRARGQWRRRGRIGRQAHRGLGRAVVEGELLGVRRHDHAPDADDPADQRRQVRQIGVERFVRRGTAVDAGRPRPDGRRRSTAAGGRPGPRGRGASRRAARPPSPWPAAGRCR